jgi:hypothetical protein
VRVRPVTGKADQKAFIGLPFRLYATDPHWVPPLKTEVRNLITPGKNPWFEHGEAQLFLATSGSRVTGRISAHIDHLALGRPPELGMGPGMGNWGLFESEDEATARALIERAEAWMRGKGMTRSVGPLSLSMWDEPGLLTHGHDHPPTVMMGHNCPVYRDWIEAAGYAPTKLLHTYTLDITKNFPPIIQRIIASGERNKSIRIRRVDKSRFDEEAKVILGLLNDGWSENWGAVPITDSEVTHIGKKLKPIVFEDLIRIAEVNGEPVAFMISVPDLNEALVSLNGSLFPLGWIKLYRWLRVPRSRTVRVPLMGVVKRLQSSRLASQLAFMMIELIRRDAVAKFGSTRGEIGWVLEDNKGMVAIASAIESTVNKTYTIYEKQLNVACRLPRSK